MIERIKFLGNWFRQFGTMVGRQYLDDGCQSTAAALTYQTLFAVVPLLTVMYSMFNAFAAFEGVNRQIEDFVFSNVIPENVDVVQQYLSSFSEQAQNLSGPSLALLAATAFLMLYTIEKTFNEIWRVREPRGGYQRFLMYWALLTLGPMLIGVGFAISTYVVSLPLVSDVTAGTSALQFVPFFMSASIFTLIYLTVPNCLVPFKHAAIGGVAVATAFEIAKYSFADIMASSSFEVIYGTFAAVPLFLLWIYVSWTIVLVGAEFVKGLSVFRYNHEAHLESPFVQLLLIIELFYRAHERGDVISERDVRKLAARIDVSHWNDLRALLMDLDLIKSVDGGGIVLTKDLKDISVWDLYQKVPFDMPQQVGGDLPWERALNDRLRKIVGNSSEYLKVSLESLFQSSRPETVQDMAESENQEEKRSVV